MDWEIQPNIQQRVEVGSFEEKDNANRDDREVKMPYAQIKKADFNLPIWPGRIGCSEETADDTTGSEFQITVDSKLTIPKRFLSDELVGFLKERLIFKNPGYFNRLRFGKLKRGEEPWIFCIWQSEDGRHLVIPRGFTHDLVNILHGHRLKPELIDRTRKPKAVDFSFMGGLYGYQKDALQGLLPYRFGILQGGLGYGKKVTCLKLVCERRCRALVVVKTKRQMYNWATLVRNFILGADNHIGFIGDGRQDLERNIIIAIDRSLYRCLSDIIPNVGFLIIDECRMVNLKILYKIVLPMDCRYMLGLSHVSRRFDGLDRLMRAFIGPVRSQMEPQDGHESTPKPFLIVRETTYAFDYRENYGEMITDLSGNDERNNLIITDILQDTSHPRSRGILISERLEHLKIFQGLLKSNYKESRILNSRITEKQRIQLYREFDRGALQIILTTLKSLFEIEVRYVNYIYMAAPLKIGEHMSQIISRLMTTSQGNEPGKIYEYLDRGVNVLRASFASRLKFYRSVGFHVE